MAEKIIAICMIFAVTIICCIIVDFLVEVPRQLKRIVNELEKLNRDRTD